MNALLSKYETGLAETGQSGRPGIVHRLDRDTSGLILIAKADSALYRLQRLMHDRKIEKTYLALVTGDFREKTGYIESYIGRHPSDRRCMTTVDPISPRLAKTAFEVIGSGYDDTTLIRVSLLTGRTHQIRVHFASIGHPVAGDALYGDESTNRQFSKAYRLSRQWLHAYALSFEFL